MKIDSTKVVIGQYSDYLICDPDGIGSPDGMPRMWPPDAAYEVLAELQRTVETLTRDDRKDTYDTRTSSISSEGSKINGVED
jgi:hypothetical protein